MTDESRFRSPRAIGQAQPAAVPSRVRRTEDPLAELARLIGQEDPFAEFTTHRPADSRAAGNLGIQRRPRTPDGRGYDGRSSERSAEWRRPAARAPEPSQAGEEYEMPLSPRPNGRGAYAYGGGPTPRADDALPAPLHGRRAETAEPRREFERAPHADARTSRRLPARPLDEEAEYDQFRGTDYDPDYVEDGYLPAHGDEFYDEAPRRRLKPWLLAGAAAAAIVIVGASGLFAYRAIFGVTGDGSPPVTIRPEAGPTKMVPGSSSKSADAGNKQIYDRVGGESSSGERIVSREERPLDRASPAAAPAPSRIPAAGTVTAVPQAVQTPPPNVSTEPRRVRTVTVRADGTIVQDQSRNAATAPAQRAAPGPSQPSNEPLALNNPTTRPGPASTAPALPPARPSTTSAAPQPSDNPWANVSGNAQLSAPRPTTQAALAPQPTPGAVPSNPPPIVAVNTPPPAGSYVVQVAAQKSEADAQTTWVQLQQRYPAILGGQQAAIRRVDLGERGVFYRAQVGPFNTRSQASEVCQSLKAAGGECVIQRN